jgi:hypothetical protein
VTRCEVEQIIVANPAAHFHCDHAAFQDHSDGHLHCVACGGDMVFCTPDICR